MRWPRRWTLWPKNSVTCCLGCLSLIHIYLLGDGRIHQFCIRSGDREEFQFAARHTDIHKFDFTGLQELSLIHI